MPPLTPQIPQTHKKSHYVLLLTVLNLNDGNNPIFGLRLSERFAELSERASHV